MKKYVALTMVLVVLLSLVGCNSQAADKPSDGMTSSDTIQQEENEIEIPVDFDVIPEEKLLELPEKSSLDSIIDKALDSIGVEHVKYKAYGNYDDIASISETLDVFVITNTDKSLMVSVIFMSSSKEWDVMYINDAESKKFYYIMPGADATEDIYDYKTGELISKQSMTHDELSDKIGNDQEELNDNLKFIGIQSWANCISEKNHVCSIDDGSVLVLLRAEGRTVEEMMSDFEKFSSMFPALLQSSEFQSGIVAVISDDNDVWFGWSFKADGEVSSFLNSEFSNN